MSKTRDQQQLEKEKPVSKNDVSLVYECQQAVGAISQSEKLTLPHVGRVLLIPAGEWSNLTTKMNEVINRLVKAEEELGKVPVDRLRNETRNCLKQIILISENERPFSLASLTRLDKLSSLAARFTSLYDYSADPLKLLPLEEEATES